MKKITDYNNKTLSECFNTSAMDDVNAECVELQDKDAPLSIMLENGKYLSYFGTRFAKVDDENVIHVFKNFMR